MRCRASILAQGSTIEQETTRVSTSTRMSTKTKNVSQVFFLLEKIKKFSVSFAEVCN